LQLNRQVLVDVKENVGSVFEIVVSSVRLNDTEVPVGALADEKAKIGCGPVGVRPDDKTSERVGNERYGLIVLAADDGRAITRGEDDLAQSAVLLVARISGTGSRTIIHGRIAWRLRIDAVADAVIASAAAVARSSGVNSWGTLLGKCRTRLKREDNRRNVQCSGFDEVAS
jgi:hypothetical protein